METCQVCISPSASAVFLPFVGVGDVDGDHCDRLNFWVLGSDYVEWALALKAHKEPAWLGRFGGVVFDHIRRLQGLADFGWSNLTFEHALDCVGAVENSGHGLIILWEQK